VTEQRDIVEVLEIYAKSVILTGPVHHAAKQAAAEITRLREQLRIARDNVAYVRRALDHYAPSITKMKQRLDDTLARMDAQEVRNDQPK